jgi:short subunit dehydrogenase-like uncharacterized protein
MVGRGLRPVLAGRDGDRLRLVASEFSDLEVATADVRDPESVSRLLRFGDVLVSTVGPFSRLGHPAIRAAIEAGAIYLDSTAEPSFIRRVFEEYGPVAERNGASLLTAFGCDYLPGNLAGAWAINDAGIRVVRVEVGYFITGGGFGQGFSRGTLRSGIESVTEPVFSWQNGLRGEQAGLRMRRFTIGGKHRPALSIRGTEQYALPRLSRGIREVDVYLGWFGAATTPLHWTARLRDRTSWLPDIGPVVARLGGAISRFVPAEPNAALLSRATSQVVAEAFSADGALLADCRFTAPEPYLLTADLLAWGAGRAAEQGVSGVGALGPVEAFGLEALTEGAVSCGLVRM